MGLTLQEARVLSKYFFAGGFLGLPFLWFVSCYYFWPVLQASLAEMKEDYSRRDVVPGDEPTEFTPVLLEGSYPRRLPSPQKDKIVAFCKLLPPPFVPHASSYHWRSRILLVVGFLGGGLSVSLP